MAGLLKYYQRKLIPVPSSSMGQSPSGLPLQIALTHVRSKDMHWIPIRGPLGGNKFCTESHVTKVDHIWLSNKGAVSWIVSVNLVLR